MKICLDSWRTAFAVARAAYLAALEAISATDAEAGRRAPVTRMLEASVLAAAMLFVGVGGAGASGISGYYYITSYSQIQVLHGSSAMLSFPEQGSIEFGIAVD